MWTIVLTSALFVVLGLLFMFGKASFLIAGYNNMPKEEKDRLDEKAVCRFMGRMMFFFAFAMLLRLADFYYPGYYLTTVSDLLIPAGVIFTVFYTNSGRRFVKK